jgi:hypothetical protein
MITLWLVAILVGRVGELDWDTFGRVIRIATLNILSAIARLGSTDSVAGLIRVRIGTVGVDVG